MDFIWCSVQSPELRLTLLRETLFVCLVQSPRLWLTAEEVGFLDYDSIFVCLVQSPRLWLTLVRENIIFCLVQSPRLWLLNDEELTGGRLYYLPCTMPKVEADS